ncbi:putative alpha mannosyltransferase protein [Botrytis fragariae]|uniref:Putative alpha mannosyltransferase protein n=1 Tax=Botrytis fragariae TaxID=1964551 RepID=A0A8H6AWJ5_9HELO|nr:putative alpha mannosyltransferase protein [Botrytis fragariae]KAF5874902.1 putative alpha mannosyltransferase protein [Botrytis fragariae]
MLFNPPRNSPRLFCLALLSTLCLCFLFQWRRELSSPKTSWKLLPSPLSPEISVKDPKPRFESFLSRLLEQKPSNSSLELPDGYVLVRIEEINEESERIDHLTLSQEDLDISTKAHLNVVELLPEYSDLITYAPKTNGLITVGGGSYTPALLVSIRMLRKTNCTLPIEVFIPTHEDYDPYSCSILASLNAKCIFLPSFQNVTIDRYQYKSLAFLFSTFESVLFLDADNFPLVDPTTWFSAPVFQEKGMITWPDFWANTASPLFYTLANQSIPAIQSQHASSEAGSILISRNLHSQTLLLAFYYNLFGPGFYYEMLAQKGIGGEGDKETWVAAANVLKKDYWQVRERNHALVSVEQVEKEEEDEEGNWRKTGEWVRVGEENLDEVVAMVQFDFIADYEASFPTPPPSSSSSSWRLDLKTKKDSNDSETEIRDVDIPTSRNNPDAKIVFLHANRIKLHPAEVLERLDDFHGRGRMWGRKRKRFNVLGEIWKRRFGERLSRWRVGLEILCCWRGERKRERRETRFRKRRCARI